MNETSFLPARPATRRPGRPRSARWAGAAALALVGLLTAACGSSSPPASQSTVPKPTASGSLAGICPNPLRIATYWTPEVELGGYYQLAAPGGTIDAAAKTYTSQLVDPFSGRSTGIDVALLAGGPAVGFLKAEQVLYEQADVLLGVDATDTQVVVYPHTPTVAIETMMQGYPTVLIWDPTVHHFSGIRDIGRSNATVLYFTGAGYMAYLTGAGILKKSQVQGGYNGSPGELVSSGGSIVFQGFAESEPYKYTHELPAWDKTIAYQLVSSVGYDPYQTITVTMPGNVTKYAACFRKLVPMLQEAEVRYVENPGPVDSLIVNLINHYLVGGPYPLALATYGVKAMLADRIIAQPPSGGFGSMDLSRVQKTIDQLVAAGAAPGLPAGFSASTIATNEFIDPSVSLRYSGPYNNTSGVITVKGVNG